LRALTGNMMAKSTRKSSIKSPTPLLEKWKKNQIFEAIQAVGLDPREFDLDDDGTEVGIKYKRSKSCFIVGGNAGHYVGRYVVGDALPWPFDVYSWQAVISRVRRWFKDVKRDLATPDLWAELQQGNELLGALSDDVIENTPFTPHEQKEIAERLREFAEQARRTHSLSEAQVQALDAKIDSVIDAAGRLGRKDWFGIFAGAILIYIVTAALPPESARDIFLGLVRAIGHFSGLPELPIG
jgi:hypothetical protein